MSALDQPKLRPGLQVVASEDPGSVVITDVYRIGEPIKLSRAAFDVIRLFDGERTIDDIQIAASALFEGANVPRETITNLIAGLDREYCLESPRLQERLNVKVRPPSCLGVYDADPEKARKQIQRLFTANGGPGLPGEPGSRMATAGRVKAVLLPHMDYIRGNVTYGWGLKEIIERTDATLFVVIATSHYSPKRFTLTRQDFQTPFGNVETDNAYIDRLVHHYGPGLFDDPYAHIPEHSIELEVVALKCLLEWHRPFKIVPLLVGSFFTSVEEKLPPTRHADIAKMIAALKAVEAESNDKICYIISGDLAHIGPKFDDIELVDDDQLAHSKKQDLLLIQHAEAGDCDRYFRVIADEEDARRICGLPPTYVAMQAAGIRKGKLLHYGRFIHSEGFESVSFASMAFE